MTLKGSIWDKVEKLEDTIEQLENEIILADVIANERIGALTAENKELNKKNIEVNIELSNLNYILKGLMEGQK